MTNAEIGLKPNGALNGWDNMQPPDSSERENSHESAIARIGRIISSKASEIIQSIRENYQSRREAAIEEKRAYEEQEAQQEEAENKFYEYNFLSLVRSSPHRKEALDQVPEDRRERVIFVDKNLDLFQECPSVGRFMTQEEAYQIYDDYSGHVAGISEEERPQTKLGILTEMETMYEEMIAAAKANGDEEAVRQYQTKYDMVQDLESITSTAECYRIIDEINIFGSKTLLRRYAREKIAAEGYNGTREMREQKPPIVGGILSVEATLSVLDDLDSDAPMSEIWENLDLDRHEGDVDWEAVEQFSWRGKELHDYYKNLRAAAEKKRQISEYDGFSKKFKDHAELLRSETPIEELPEQLQKAIEAEKVSQIVEELRTTLEANRRRIATLRSDREINPRAQSELERRGLTREGYALILEQRSKELETKIAQALDHDFTEELRTMIDSREISRDDLADRFERHSQLYAESAATCRQDFQQFREMFKRTEDGFKQEFLLDGQEGIPSCPQDVADYLYSNYRFDGLANNIGLREQSLSLRKKRLEFIMKNVQKRSEWLSHTARFVDRKFTKHLAFDIEDHLHDDPGVQEIPELYTATCGTGEIYPSQIYTDESTFLNEQVIPSIQAIMDAIDQKIQSTNGQPAGQQAAA
ncbi:hypothetical protein J5500_01330 [Candidatus Saccharibacteria bacterium]|nr:hypothetical protein [Candidatus Saccharibacteria bacterium]